MRDVPRPRPRFELDSELSPEELLRRMKKFLAVNDRIKGAALVDRLEIAYVRGEQHFWSPQLIVNVSRAGAGSHLAARFGPHPHVWGMCVAIYLVLAFLSLIASAYGASQWMVHEPPTAFLAVPGALLAAGLLFGASFIGQGLGFEQMYELRATLTRISEGRSGLEAPGEPPSGHAA